jgi:hypothetical protein
MKRVITWAACVIALVGLGVLIHAGTPPTPRWSAPIASRDQELTVQLAGDRLLTMPFGDREPSGPLEVRDAVTREVLVTGWEDRAETKGFRFSPDGGSGAGVVSKRAGAALRWVELSTGKEHEVTLGPGNWGEVFFSEDGRSLLVHEMRLVPGPMGPVEAAGPRLARLFDPATGRLLGNPQLGAGVSFAFVGRQLLLVYPDRERVELWNPSTDGRTPLTTNGYGITMSPDDRRVLITTDAGLDLWSLDAPPKRLAVVPVRHEHTVYFSDDSRLAVVAPNGEVGTHPLRFWDADTGRKLWEYPLTDTTGPTTLEASADGRWFAVNGEKKLHVLDLAEKRLAWTWPTTSRGVFSPDSASLIVYQTADAKVHVLDAATGRERASISMPTTSGDPPRFRAGGRQLWLSASGRDEEMPDGWLAQLMRWVRPPVPDEKAGVLLGLAWPSRRELLRLTDRGVREYHVADDGSFVITVHEEGDRQVLRRWDIPQPRPWGWIVGVPLTLGAALLGLWWKLTPAPVANAPGSPESSENPASQERQRLE